MATHNELGKLGEDMACNVLLSKGYVIRHRNWQAEHCELDIVAQKDNFLVIIEVKTRSSNYFGNPEKFVTRTKIKRIVKAAQRYIDHYTLDCEMQFDVITVLKNHDGTFTVEHLEDVVKIWEA
ncbi:MAG: YraN family protein [Bacteroidales bacterium]|jgi:putative endonuclease|nr:YraN family protein [Bacteroidales bacterium]